MVTGMEQPYQFLLTTKIGGSVKLFVGIVNPFRTRIANRIDPNIQTTIVHSNQVIGPGHSYREYLPLEVVYSGTDIPRSGKNIDNRTRMNPHGHIVTIIPEYNSARNYCIFDSVSSMVYVAYRFLMWHGAETSKSETLEAKKLRK